MVDSNDMRERARRCIRLAGKSKSITINLTLLRVAKMWFVLANQCERGEIKKEEAANIMAKGNTK